MNIEQHLQDQAEAWLDKEALAPSRAFALEHLVKRRASRRRWKRAVAVAASAAAVMVSVTFGDVLVSLASGTPIVGPFIADIAKYDGGMYWAADKGFVVPVGKEDTAAGYTLQVDSVVADDARTVLFWTIEGPGISEENASFKFDPRMNLGPAGPFSGRHEVRDGRMVGSLELPALPTPTAVVRLRADEIAGVEGSWSVSFMASRLEAKAETRQIVPANAKLDIAGHELTVQAVLQAPTQTVVKMSGDVAVDVDFGWPKLLVNGGEEVAQQGGHKSTHRPNNAAETMWEADYRFDRLPSDASELTLSFGEVVRWLPESVSVPLAPGSEAQIGPLEIRIDEVGFADGKTTITGKLRGESIKRFDFAQRLKIVARAAAYSDGVSTSYYWNEDVPNDVKVVFTAEGDYTGGSLLFGSIPEVVPGPYTMTIPVPVP